MENKFVDAQEMARLHPATFEAPTQERLDALRVGEAVKVCVDGERFWTDITAIDGDKITATVANDLIFTHEHGLSFGEEIQFEKRHIYQTED